MYRFLVIDDDKDARTDIIRLISSEFKEFQLAGTAEDGSKAVSLIKQQKPDVILTDIYMPIMDGLELTRYVKNNDPEIKVVILSIYKDFDYAQKAMDYGACAYILKPFSKDQIVKTFDQLKADIEKKRNENKKLKESRRILQESFFRNLVNQRIKDADVIENTMKELQISFKNRYFTIAVFGFDHSDGCEHGISAELTERILEICGEYRSDYDHAIFNDHDIFCMVFSSNEKISRNETILEANRIKRHIECGLSAGPVSDMNISIGIGKTVFDLKDICNSYREAIAALNMRYFHGVGKCFHSEDIRREDCLENDHAGIDEKLDHLIHAILGNDLLAIKRIIISLTGISANKGQVSPNMLYINYVEIILMLNHKLKENGISIKALDKHHVYDMLNNTYPVNDLRTKFKEILENIIRDVDLYKKCYPNWFVFKIKEYVNKNLSAKIQNEDIAKIVGLSTPYFSTVFKEKTGKTFSEYLLEARIEKAKEMLKSTFDMVYEIAEKVGFNDYRYFCKVFKNAVGLSPLEYRKDML